MKLNFCLLSLPLLSLALFPAVSAEWSYRDSSPVDQSRDRWECKWRQRSDDGSWSPIMEQSFPDSKFNVDKWQLGDDYGGNIGTWDITMVNFDTSRIPIDSDKKAVTHKFRDQYTQFMNDPKDGFLEGKSTETLPDGLNCVPYRAGQPSDYSEKAFGSPKISNPLPQPKPKPEPVSTWKPTQECSEDNVEACKDNGPSYEVYGCRVLCYGLKEHPYKGGENSFGAKANCELEGYYEPVVDSSSKTSYVCGLHTTPAYGPAGFRAACRDFGGKENLFVAPQGMDDPEWYRRR